MAAINALDSLPDCSIPASANLVFTESTSIEETGRIWRQLETQWQSTAIASSWLWISTWLRHYGDQVDWCFVTGSLGDTPVGIALLTASLPFPAPRVGFRGIVHIGTAGEHRADRIMTENNHLLTAPGYEKAFTIDLLNHIRARFRPIGVQFDAFPSKIIDQVFSRNAPGHMIVDMPCPVFDLQAVRKQGTDVLSTLGSGVRGRIRRSDRGFGTLQGEWASTESHALDIFDELATLHQARWEAAGKPGAFASDRFNRFHREIIQQSFQSGNPAILFRLRNEQDTIGCLYSFVENGEVLFYQSGFAATSDNRLKPGLSTHAACMQECLDRGFHTYNFLGGDSRYKRELSSGERMLRTATLYRYDFIPQGINLLIRWGFRECARSLKHWYERRLIAGKERAT